MIGWTLLLSLVSNLVLLVTWLKSREDCRSWKACARIGFEAAKADVEPSFTPSKVVPLSRPRRKDTSSLN